MTKYYKITEKDMIPINKQQWEKLPNDKRHATEGRSNTLKDNLKGEWNHTEEV